MYRRKHQSVERYLIEEHNNKCQQEKKCGNKNTVLLNSKSNNQCKDQRVQSKKNRIHKMINNKIINTQLNKTKKSKIKIQRQINNNHNNQKNKLKIVRINVKSLNNNN